MFITTGHFLSPFTMVLRKEKVLGLVHSVDTDLMVAIRIVGFNSEEETPILDLVSVDYVCFITTGMPGHLEDLLPDGIDTYSREEFNEKFKINLEEKSLE